MSDIKQYRPRDLYAMGVHDLEDLLRTNASKYNKRVKALGRVQSQGKGFSKIYNEVMESGGLFTMANARFQKGYKPLPDGNYIEADIPVKTYYKQKIDNLKSARKDLDPDEYKTNMNRLRNQAHNAYRTGLLRELYRIRRFAIANEHVADARANVKAAKQLAKERNIQLPDDPKDLVDALSGMSYEDYESLSYVEYVETASYHDWMEDAKQDGIRGFALAQFIHEKAVEYRKSQEFQEKREKQKYVLLGSKENSKKWFSGSAPLEDDYNYPSNFELDDDDDDWLL